jgi:hypothetical protein
MAQRHGAFNKAAAIRRDDRDFAMLDTHDSLTDYYKHRRNVEEIAAALGSCQLKEISVGIGANGIEGRAVKPFASPT